jgi:hypothetical protein
MWLSFMASPSLVLPSAAIRGLSIELGRVTPRLVEPP